jgi:hypothetical protein
MKMIAKKPADRYQTAAEVARELAAWLVGRGQSVVSDGGDVSSGILVKAAAGGSWSAGGSAAQAGEAPAPRSRTGETPPSSATRGSPSSKLSQSQTPPPGSGRIVSPSGSGRMIPPPGMPPLPVRATSLVDTSPGTNHPTVKGLGSGGSGSRTAKNRLPVARPLEEPPRRSDFVLDDEAPASLSGLKSASSPQSDLLPSTLLGRKSTPPWIWLLVLAGFLFVAIFVWAVGFFTQH